MNIKHFMSIVVLTALIIVACSGGAPSEPVVYTHQKAGFKITAPAGWKKMSEDSEMYEFRMGNFKLIEVGGFDLEFTAEELADITITDIADIVKEATMGGLEGYCEEATIDNWNLDNEAETTWGGVPGYRVKARGYSEEADKDMIVDLIGIFNVKNGYMYMFASQIETGVYDKTKPELEACIASFAFLH
jgi:hypothetical protein